MVNKNQTDQNIESLHLRKKRQSWINEDLHQLRHEDVTKQLGVLFGEDEADHFMNPKVQEESKSKIKIVESMPKVSYQQGAHMLWNHLRSNSEKKLLHETRNMKTTVVLPLNNKKQQQRLHHVEQYRQRVELMHKIAQLNADKTKQLLKTIKLPAIAPEDYYVSNSVSTLVKKEKPKKLQSTLKRISPDYSRASPDLYATPIIQDRPISFLTEKDCETPGSFKRRLQENGIIPKVGISRPQILYRSNSEIRSEPIIPNKRNPVFISYKNEQSKSSNPNTNNVPKSYTWQPLTLNALSEYACSIPAPGSGDFHHGSARVWRPTTSTIRTGDVPKTNSLVPNTS
ncbi:uncharacterized protein [Clytia hemisphaerica]|uniref:Uncharacterized protein n=1 Tax=Clytia hemisphaerica TaxID=252671 RepID=A0A7M5WX48_9CNID